MVSATAGASVMPRPPGPVTSQISLMSEAGDGVFYYAEAYHQQYLFTNPNGYRCHAPTGLTFPAAG